MASLTIAFTSLLYIPKGNAQYNTYGYAPFLYPLTIPPELNLSPANGRSFPLNPLVNPLGNPLVNPLVNPVVNPLLNPLVNGLVNGLSSSSANSSTNRLSSFNSVANRVSSSNVSNAYNISNISNISNTSNTSNVSYPSSPLASALSLANLGIYAANPLSGLGPFASLVAAASFAVPQVFAGSEVFQPYLAQSYLPQPYPAQAYPTQPYQTLPYLTLPYASLQGNLISWPRAEVLTSATSPVAPVYYTYTVVNTFPHDRTAFTEGLVYNNGFLYEGTGIPGRSQVRKEDLLTGTVLQSLDLPAPYFGEGITIYGNTIIELTWQSNIGFVYDKATFVQLQTFTYPTEGWGLTHDGKNLIMSDGTATLHFLDPATFAQVGSIDVYDQNGPVTMLNELEYIKGEIYANVWLTNRIAIISPITGHVVGWIDLTGLLSPADIVFPIDVLNGIAYDAKNDRLFVTGKLWPKLFEIDLVPLS